MLRFATMLRFTAVAFALMLAACSESGPSKPGKNTDAGMDGTVDNITDASTNMGSEDGGVDGSADDASTKPVINPLPARVANTTCELPEPGATSPYEFERVFAQIPFSSPVWVGHAPGLNTLMFVVQREGTIRIFDFDHDVTTADDFLTLDVRKSGLEEGLLGLAFHPDYSVEGRFYVNYVSKTGCNNGTRCTVVSEFVKNSNRMADAGSERELMRFDQPYKNHNGGDMRFGADGHRYISVGDGGAGGSGADASNHGQNPMTWFGSILRIDIDKRPLPAEYGIPASNPFADGMAGAPEVYAYGLRNPWRIHVDPTNGALWLGDVGESRVEEINKITTPGVNLGWKVQEGSLCFFPSSNCDTNNKQQPLYEYGRNEGMSITGGLVYRGTEHPELIGQYLFADYVSGTIWALKETNQGPEVTELGSVLNPSSFGTAPDGEVYITSLAGRVYRLSKNSVTDGFGIPRKLSDTGCFADTETHTLADGVVPFDVSVPLWSDGAGKLRYLALPEGENATPATEGPYDFPTGTVFIKTFTLPEQGRQAPRRLETRMFAKHQSGWAGYTWRWDDDQKDATLLDGSFSEVINTPSGMQTWDYPSRSQCNQCHTTASGVNLGFRTRQLNREFDDAAYNQLKALQESGYIDALPGAVNTLGAHGFLDDENVSLEKRARAILDVNCASCHQPGGGPNTPFDYRAEVSFKDTKACNGDVSFGNLGVADAKEIFPGDADKSVLYLRMNLRGGKQMPPIGTRLVDPQATEIVADWIDSLTGCPQ